MLKHVSGGTNSFKPLSQSYDSLGRVDSISLNSSASSNDSSLNDSSDRSSPSRSSSLFSVHFVEAQKVVIKIYTRVLCTDVEYKTLPITNQTTCKEIVQTILNKFRLKNRDPNLFYLTLEAWIKQTGIPIRSVMTLEDDACPAMLQSCYTQKDMKFTLMMRRGCIVKITNTCLPQGPLHINLLISERTTVAEVIKLLLNCIGSSESCPTSYQLYECSPSYNSERRLAPNELPVAIQADWPNPDFKVFQLRSAGVVLVDHKPKSISTLLNTTVHNFRKNLKTEFTFSLSKKPPNKPEKMLFI